MLKDSRNAFKQFLIKCFGPVSIAIGWFQALRVAFLSTGEPYVFPGKLPQTASEGRNKPGGDRCMRGPVDDEPNEVSDGCGAKDEQFFRNF